MSWNYEFHLFVYHVLWLDWPRLWELIDKIALSIGGGSLMEKAVLSIWVCQVWLLGAWNAGFVRLSFFEVLVLYFDRYLAYSIARGWAPLGASECWLCPADLLRRTCTILRSILDLFYSTWLNSIGCFGS